jgi:hypothetical protein
MKYHVSHIGQNYGPWSLDEILQRLAKMELIASDFIFDETKQEWVPLMEFQPLVQALKGTKPAAPPKPNRAVETTETLTTPTITTDTLTGTTTLHADEKAEWFVQKQSHRFGPLSYAGLIRALQEKQVYEFELIWKEGMGEWIRVAEHPEFTPEKIKAALKTPASSRAFLQRKHARFTYMNDVMVHDDTCVYLGQSFQGGAGGAGVIIENATFQPGQTVLLHFATHDGIPAFNVEAEIVSKRYVKDVRDKKTPIPYGVQFKRMDEEAAKLWKRYFKEKGAA